MYRKGQRFVPEAHVDQDPAKVPEVLQAWIQALGSLDQAHQIQQALLHLLSTCPGCTPQSPQVAYARSSHTRPTLCVPLLFLFARCVGVNF